MAGTVQAIRNPLETSAMDVEPAEHLGAVASVTLLQLVHCLPEHVATHHAFPALHREDEAEGVDRRRLFGTGETQGGIGSE